MYDTLMRLAEWRPVFHSEADLQHALAWQLQRDDPELRVRLEYCPDPRERARVDIWTVADEPSLRTAIELKYLVRATDTTVNGERVVLRNQGAYDISRYDVIKDITRVERWVDARIADRGYVIVLSNDPGYWNRSERDTIDWAFRLHDGQFIEGTRAWADRAGPGTTKGRADPLVVLGSYTLRWRPFSTVDGRSIRALTIPIVPQ